MKMAILYISHHLLSVAALCHRIAILHEGKIVECDLPELIFNSPRHPYTRRLIATLPSRPPGIANNESSAPSSDELLATSLVSQE